MAWSRSGIAPPQIALYACRGPKAMRFFERGPEDRAPIDPFAETAYIRPVGSPSSIGRRDYPCADHRPYRFEWLPNLNDVLAPSARPGPLQTSAVRRPGLSAEWPIFALNARLPAPKAGAWGRTLRRGDGTACK